MFRVGVLLLLLLSGCSKGVVSVCDKNGICMESWNITTLASSTTITQLRTAGDTPVVGTTVTTTGPGVIADVDPLDLAAQTTLTTAKSGGL